MKSFIAPVVFSLLAVRASAQNTPQGCPTTYNPACPFVRSTVNGNATDFACAATFLPPTDLGSSNVCPGGPVASCDNLACNFLCGTQPGLAGSITFCNAVNVTSGVQGCRACADSRNPTGTTTQTTATTQTAASTATNTGCPAALDPACPYWCPYKSARTEPGYCTTDFMTGPGTAGCQVCPGNPSVCPATPAASCAFICQGVGSVAVPKFCYNRDISQENVLTCTACASATGGSSTPTVAPPPAYTGAASRLSLSGGALAGVAALVALNI